MNSLRVCPFEHPLLPKGFIGASAPIIDETAASFWRGFLPSSIQSASLVRQREFTTGRLLIHDLAGRADVASTFPLAIQASGMPTWPIGHIGSISHTSTTAFAILGPASSENCGCDVEEIIPDAVMIHVEPEVLTAIESTKVTSSSARAVDVTLIFSAKESIYKAVFPTLRQFFDYSAFELEFKNDHMLRFRRNLAHPLADSLPDQATVYYSVDATTVFTWTSELDIP